MIDKIILWTWPDADHADAVANGMAECDLHDWKARLASVMDDLEKSSQTVADVTIPVAEMLRRLAERVLENTPDNRATIAVELFQEKQ